MDLSDFISVLSGNNPVCAAYLLKDLLNNNKGVQRHLEEVSKCALIVKSINIFVQDKLRTSKGCYKKYDREAMMAVLTACSNNLGNFTNKNSIREAIGISKNIFIQASRKINLWMKVTVKKGMWEKKYITKVKKQCVLDFCHSDKVSQIDSNSHQIAEVVFPSGRKEKHVGQVWSVLTVDEQHTLFKQSKKSRLQFLYTNDGFTVPSRTFFHK